MSTPAARFPGPSSRADWRSPCPYRHLRALTTKISETWRLVAGSEVGTGQVFELGHQTSGSLEEIVPVLGGNRRGVRQLDLERVPVSVAHPELVVQVGTGGEAGTPDATDHLTLHHAVASLQTLGVAGEMRVQGRVLIAVSEDDRLPVSALAADEVHSAVSGGPDRRASRRGVVDAVVLSQLVQDGMVAEPEARADAREVHRSAQERLAHARAFRGVVLDGAALVLVAKGPDGAVAVYELGGHYCAVGHRPVRLVELFVDDREAVTAANVEGEVDVPAEYLRRLHREPVREAGAPGGQVERVVNLRVYARQPAVELRAMPLGHELAFLSEEVQRLDFVRVIDEMAYRAAGVHVDLELLIRPKPLERPGVLSRAKQVDELGDWQVFGEEDGVERIAACHANLTSRPPVKGQTLLERFGRALSGRRCGRRFDRGERVSIADLDAELREPRRGVGIRFFERRRHAGVGELEVRLPCSPSPGGMGATEGEPAGTDSGRAGWVAASPSSW